MSKYDPTNIAQERPTVSMAPLIDIIFLTLIFFMTLSVYAQLESEINISVPKSETSTEVVRSAGEIMINITKTGEYIVNQEKVNTQELEIMLKRISNLFPDQPVIIRADEETVHKHIVGVLDACAKANIWDISFATITAEK